MDAFTAAAAHALGGPDSLRARRAEAFEAVETVPLPTEKEEVWRYTPIDRLDLGSYRPVGHEGPAAIGDLGLAFVGELGTDVAARAGLAVAANGTMVSAGTQGLPLGLRVRSVLQTADAAEGLGSVLVGGDALVRLNDAFAPDVVAVDVAPGVELAAPLLLVHWCEGQADAAGRGPAVFPRTVVRVGAGARASVVEVVAGAPGPTASLVVPVTELEVADGGSLAYVSVQLLGAAAWHIGRIAGRVGREGTLRAFTMGLGASYDRMRTDVAAVGQGASTELRSAYLGSGDQVHDVRTQQEHAAPRTTSDLLCKGAVADASRSVYSGLIQVRHGAVRADAMQTNHALVLSEGAHADSVPNLDIAENDVRCSHASTVGPIDEDQRSYLESRGIPPERADRLIVLGFYDDVIDRLPVPELAPRLRRQVGERLASVFSASGGSDG
ncbi:MAG TPA: SufD family Fe-S cluster assembly protein [Acidimicrobiales bacterium]|nr:SufD family Fe-S cluster assembly protein [Acidimicrobiales bacterium]